MKMKTAPATGVVDCGFACHTRVAAKACGHEFDPPGGAQRRAWPGNFRWTLQDALDATLDRPRSNADLLILFALAAMTLAAVGLYGLDHSSLIIYTIVISSILYFQRNTTGASLISSKY
jgi:hypothetical protein